ncbi:acyl-CoA dehydrogenase [Skermania sp. ID1734]|uniref:acyl-CoA dehydrogenase family protein n=1 Tax=Skermania sp. ID1734 TaxID=2597516 RepID=UPI00117ECBC3|nr:acyl-CoA dehydrogenase family protein [Skermania sp. ID1734]TSD96503.1 acyl-CoA dehydrogenase [Skermania sp. ID1734]
MDFTPTEAQRDLAQLTRTIAGKLLTPPRLAELDSAASRFDTTLWHALADAGVLSAALPESVGGNDLGVLEQCSVLVELGRAVAPVPYLWSIALAGNALAEFGTEAQRDLARRAADGDVVLTVALDEECNDEPARPVSTAQPAADGWTLHGSKTLVPFGAVAQLLLVPAATPSGVGVFIVDMSAPGVTVTEQRVTDHSPAAMIEFNGVRVDGSAMLGRPDEGGDILRWLQERAIVGVCAQQLGTIERALELVSEYARERVQFDRPIGSFQAVAQRLADAYIDVQGARLTMWQAAWSLAEGLPSDAEVFTAKFWAAEAGHRVAHTVIHVHGGVGLDTDHPVHRYFLAAKQNEFALGGATEQLRRLGATLASVPA